MLELERLGEGRYLAPHALVGAPGAVFGGQLLAQAVVAAGHELDGKPLSSLHSVFSRPVRVGSPIHIDVEVMHDGRSATSAVVSIHQGGPPCARSLALAVAAQHPELGRHAASAPDVGGPEDATPIGTRLAGVELRVAGDVDVADERGGGPPELHVWARAGRLPDVANAAPAMLALAGESHFVAAALRPHDGVSVSQAFTRFAPAVISHGIAFHAPVTAGQWWLLALVVPQLAQGRLFGRGDVFDGDGRLVASLWQENLMRPL